MEKGLLIGEGFTAEVFSWGKNEILKLFKKEFPKNGVEKEYFISKEVYENGLPAPKVGEMIEYEGRNAIIYERIFGDSMLKKITQKPWTISKEAKRLAELHFKIHKCTAVQGIPRQKEALAWCIKQTDLLADDEKQKILLILDKLPNGEVICHGDFHPGNVIVESGRAVVLDWMTATIGNPAADVARTKLILKDGAFPSNMPYIIRLILKFFRNRLYSVYLKTYLKLSNMQMEEIEQWEVPIAAARLIEWVSKSETDHLIELINSGLNSEI